MSTWIDYIDWLSVGQMPLDSISCTGPRAYTRKLLLRNRIQLCDIISTFFLGSIVDKVL